LNQRQGEVHSHLEPKNLHSTFDQDGNVLKHLESKNLHSTFDQDENVLTHLEPKNLQPLIRLEKVVEKIVACVMAEEESELVIRLSRPRP
jgi:hypothetical protein